MATELKKPISYEYNKKNDARTADFNGWKMPTFYTSIIEEHEMTRRHIGLFDVSHMGRWWFTGKNAGEFINHLITNDVSKLISGKSIYSPMCNEEGGIIDDLIVYKFNEEKFLVVNNAGNHNTDAEWFRKQLELKQKSVENYDVELDDITASFGQIAVQGPKAKNAIAKIIKDRDEDLKYFSFSILKYQDVELLVASTGYTGEQGYEIYGANNTLMDLWGKLVREYSAKPCGLGSRDLLRLEAGYCLHGNDISLETTPYEANLDWTVKLDKENFIGKEKVTKREKKLFGLSFPKGEKVIPRHGAKLYDADDNEIGYVTSGNFSPELKRGIGLAYISDKSEISKSNPKKPCHKVFMDSRGKKIEALVCETWFYRNVRGAEYCEAIKSEEAIKA